MPFQVNNLMGRKILLYFLDRVFQEFTMDLSRFATQVNSFNQPQGQVARHCHVQTLGPLKYRITLSLSLPPVLVPGHFTGRGQNQGSQTRDVQYQQATGMEQEEAWGVVVPRLWLTVL